MTNSSINPAIKSVEFQLMYGKNCLLEVQNTALKGVIIHRRSGSLPVMSVTSPRVGEIPPPQAQHRSL